MTHVPKAMLDVKKFAESDMYPENVVTSAIEARISAALPPVPGVDSSMSDSERQAAYEISVSNSRLAFIKQFGDAFGCETAQPAPLATMPVVPVPELFNI